MLEPRTAARGYIATTEDGFNVYGAGFREANGLYVRNGDLNGKPLYETIIDGAAAFTLSWTGARWEIASVVYITSVGEIVTSDGNWLYEPGDILYFNVSADATPPEAGWELDVGIDLPPYVDALSEIGEAMGFFLWREVGRWRSYQLHSISRQERHPRGKQCHWNSLRSIQEGLDGHIRQRRVWHASNSPDRVGRVHVL